ncbi:hypothetical protein D3C71_1706580 [compost metagenome]
MESQMLLLMMALSTCHILKYLEKNIPCLPVQTTICVRIRAQPIIFLLKGIVMPIWILCLQGFSMRKTESLLAMSHYPVQLALLVT